MPPQYYLCFVASVYAPEQLRILTDTGLNKMFICTDGQVVTHAFFVG